MLGQRGQGLARNEAQASVATVPAPALPASCPDPEVVARPKRLATPQNTNCASCS